MGEACRWESTTPHRHHCHSPLTPQPRRNKTSWAGEAAAAPLVASLVSLSGRPPAPAPPKPRHGASEKRAGADEPEGLYLPRITLSARSTEPRQPSGASGRVRIGCCCPRRAPAAHRRPALRGRASSSQSGCVPLRQWTTADTAIARRRGGECKAAVRSVRARTRSWRVRSVRRVRRHWSRGGPLAVVRRIVAVCPIHWLAQVTSAVRTCRAVQADGSVRAWVWATERTHGPALTRSTGRSLVVVWSSPHAAGQSRDGSARALDTVLRRPVTGGP